MLWPTTTTTTTTTTTKIPAQVQGVKGQSRCHRACVRFGQEIRGEARSCFHFAHLSSLSLKQIALVTFLERRLGEIRNRLGMTSVV